MNAPDLKLVAGNPLPAAGQSRFHESARAQVAGANLRETGSAGLVWQEYLHIGGNRREGGQ